MKLLGTSKVSTDNKITVVKEAAEIFDLKEGDLLAFYEDDDRGVYLKKASFTDIAEAFEALELLKKHYDKMQKPAVVDIPRLKHSMDGMLAAETNLDKKDAMAVINRYFLNKWG